MDFLRRELAPVSPQGWAQIDEIARQTLAANLSGRKFLDVAGPLGIDYAAVPLGRLSVPKSAKSEKVGYGVHQVLPLVETRASFTLQTWELDNIERGAKDIELEALVSACREIAAFEEKAIYGGFAPASILGLKDIVKGKELPLKLEADAFIEAVAEGQARMLKDGVEGPANLAVSPAVWKFLSRITSGGTLRSNLEKQIGGKVVYSEAVPDAILVAARGGDTELTIGQDLAIGYHSHGSAEVNFFLTESFTFRVVAPEAVLGFALK
jgi:uncharacterized linocin/CFP29 family protein